MKYNVQYIKNYVILQDLRYKASRDELNTQGISTLFSLQNDPIVSKITAIDVLDAINELAGIVTEVEDEI